MNKEKRYSSKEIAKRLLVEPVTVRKYSQMLEEKGYVFEKDEKGWRLYSDIDLRALEHFTTLKQKGFSVEESIDHIASLYHQNLSISQPDITLQKDEPLLFTFMKRQEEINRKILERLEEQEKRQVQRDQNLVITLKEVLEVKKQIATSQHKKWWEFWKS